jgi:geranylgeranylglycerol-phosphate geranylgeranyltransferase
MPAGKAGLARFGPIVHITRPQIAAQAAAYTLLGAYLNEGLPFARLDTVATAALVVALVVAFGFVSNDYVDLEVDKLNRPERPLPAGELSRDAALRLAALLAISAVAVAWLLPPLLFSITCANLALTAAYSLLLKRTVLLGNTAMALLNSSVLVFGGLATGAVAPLVWAVAGMSFVYTLGQEVLYTVDDIAGDAQLGLMTTAIYFGVGPSLLLFRALMVIVMLLALVPWWLTALSPLYLAALVLCTVLPLAFWIVPLTLQGEPRAIARACHTLPLIRLTSLLPLVLLRALMV